MLMLKKKKKKKFIHFIHSLTGLRDFRVYRNLETVTQPNYNNVFWTDLGQLQSGLKI